MPAFVVCGFSDTVAACGFVTSDGSATELSDVSGSIAVLDVGTSTSSLSVTCTIPSYPLNVAAPPSRVYVKVYLYSSSDASSRSTSGCAASVSNLAGFSFGKFHCERQY